MIQEELSARIGSKSRVLDAGCGAGSGLLWLHQSEPTWEVHGYTVSDVQYKFATRDVGLQTMHLRSYDDLEDSWDAVYAIESLVHSPNLSYTLHNWASHLAPGGVIAIIDDFVSPTGSLHDCDVQAFQTGWMIPSLTTSEDMIAQASVHGLMLAKERNIGTEYNIVGANYHGKAPPMPTSWTASTMPYIAGDARRRAMVHGKLEYKLLLFQKAV